MPFEETIPVYKHPQIQQAELLTVKTGGTYSYHLDLKV
jgi:hypothetical protein